MRRKNRENYCWIDSVVSGLPVGDDVLALWRGSPDLGSSGPPVGVFVLTNRELLWRGIEGGLLAVTLRRVERLYTRPARPEALGCVLVDDTREVPLTLLGEDDSSDKGAREFYEALGQAIRTARPADGGAQPSDGAPDAL
jgi:hypothetical protein